MHQQNNCLAGQMGRHAKKASKSVIGTISNSNFMNEILNTLVWQVLVFLSIFPGFHS